MTAPHTVRKTMAFTKRQWEYIRTQAFNEDISPSEYVRRVIEKDRKERGE